jgi:ubiquinone/menaquinone biosynthesis C-methylase UbiE
LEILTITRIYFYDKCVTVEDMEHSVAMDLIRPGIDASLLKWADLGAGSGTFTFALADLLKPECSIVAMDTDAAAMKPIPPVFNNVNILKVKSDFNIYDFGLAEFDGLIIANALHFVENKLSLFRKLRKAMSPQGRVIIIEYDTTNSSRWIPWPQDFDSLCELEGDAGFKF